MKSHHIVLCSALLSTYVTAAPIAVYKHANSNNMITYVILTDEPATNTGCDQGPYVKLAKVSLGNIPNDIGPFHFGCWISNGDNEVSVISMPTKDFKGGHGTFRVSDFEKTQAFKTWVYEEDGSVPKK